MYLCLFACLNYRGQVLYDVIPHIFVVFMIDMQGDKEEIHKIEAKEMQELKKNWLKYSCAQNTPESLTVAATMLHQNFLNSLDRCNNGVSVTATAQPKCKFFRISIIRLGDGYK